MPASSCRSVMFGPSEADGSAGASSGVMGLVPAILKTIRQNPGRREGPGGMPFAGARPEAARPDSWSRQREGADRGRLGRHRVLLPLGERLDAVGDVGVQLVQVD